MGYVSFSHGFKSGGFGLFAVGAPPALPEQVNAYIVGLKSDWFDHRFRANLEAFDYDYKHQQVEVIEGGSAVETNAAGSRIYGLDTTLTEKVTDKLTLDVNFEYLRDRSSELPRSNHPSAESSNLHTDPGTRAWAVGARRARMCVQCGRQPDYQIANVFWRRRFRLCDRQR